MQKLVFTLFILTVSTTFCQETDALKVIEISESYANRIGEAFIVKKDSLYVFRTPDIYLVNKKSFLAIKNVYQSTIDQDKMTKGIIEKYTQTLRRNIDLERRLTINFTESDSLTKIVYKKNQTILNHMQKTLDYTINRLEKATNSLVFIEKENKRQRKKTVFEKILIGIAGVGAGVLVGVSL
ncbi:MAG: hypothetical protein ABJL44_13330 [Algibacter sp.]